MFRRTALVHSFVFAFSTLVGAAMILSLLWMSVFFGLQQANAQESVDCSQYPVKGKTSVVIYKNGQTDRNSGITYFDPTVSIPAGKTIFFAQANHRVCAERKADGFQLKGWAWNDNLGWMSFYCPGAAGNNLGVKCGDSHYGVTIDRNGVFHGFAWTQAGWVTFNCADEGPQGCTKSRYKVSLNMQAKSADGYAPVLFGTPAKPNYSKTYAYSKNAGWMSFSGMQIPVTAKPVKLDNVCELGDHKCSFGEIPDEDGDGAPGISYTPGQTPISCPADAKCPVGVDCDDSNPDRSPYISEIPGDGIDNNCDGVDEKLPEPLVDPLSAATGVTFNRPLLIGNSYSLGDGQTGIGAPVRNDVRNVIFRNVQQLKHGASTQCGVLENVFAFAPADDVYYCEDDIKLGPVADWKGLKTVIVYDANVFIDGDIFPSDADTQLGLIVLRKNVNDPTKGNVYISGNVHNLRIQLYADGSIFPAVSDPLTGGKKPLRAAGGLPDLKGGSVYQENGSLFGQVLLQGLFVARNSVDEYFSKNNPAYFDGAGKKTSKETAKYYNLGFLRATALDPKKKNFNGDCSKTSEVYDLINGNENICAMPWNSYVGSPSAVATKLNSDLNTKANQQYGYGVVILYEPPAPSLPGFSSVTGNSVIQR